MSVASGSRKLAYVRSIDESMYVAPEVAREQQRSLVGRQSIGGRVVDLLHQTLDVLQHGGIYSVDRHSSLLLPRHHHHNEVVAARSRTGLEGLLEGIEGGAELAQRLGGLGDLLVLGLGVGGSRHIAGVLGLHVRYRGRQAIERHR